MTTTISNPLTRLNRCISMVEASAPAYSRDPVSDFTRKRKLPFDKLILFLLQNGLESINSSISLNFSKVEDMPSASAICQAKDKLLPECLLRILYLFNLSHPELKTFRGWTLLAFDGSAINVPFDPDDSFTLVKNGDMIYSQYHLNALYDVMNGIFYDVILDSPSKTREVKALMEIMDNGNFPEKSIFIMDRGINSYEMLAKCQEENRKVIVRSKDIDSKTGMLKNLNLPNGEFDETRTIILTRKQDKEIKSHPEKYRYLHWGVSFPLMPTAVNSFYELTIRIIRKEVEKGKFITVITNLTPDEFSGDDLIELYCLRWREEGAFLKLKYSIAMLHFNSKKRNHLQQEIYASLILYNLCSISLVEEEIYKKTEKYEWRIEFSAAVTNVRMLLRGQINWEDFKNRIKKFLVPIRPGRKHPRKIKRQSVRSLVHRAA
jgi:hypothetical protein